MEQNVIESKKGKLPRYHSSIKTSRYIIKYTELIISQINNTAEFQKSKYQRTPRQWLYQWKLSSEWGRGEGQEVPCSLKIASSLQQCSIFSSSILYLQWGVRLQQHSWKGCISPVSSPSTSFCFSAFGEWLSVFFITLGFILLFFFFSSTFCKCILQFKNIHAGLASFSFLL